ncbi:GTP-binding protein [Streptomyces sp. NBC_00102]|uniref:CobW family GTP-binding protein n=1 Tax=Streptomyces sp. NBC_00102 TaxID=2975652 RepID=UPI002257EEC5|nr:GTP-binding protein [Streptomyces sp. NBC_00102]MCX5400234.1 GTP-binding protein [Streptomyces sp. NBC_00102]
MPAPVTPGDARIPQIPVIVLAGFLGSGKTTLLNHLLHHRAGNRIGVIVNDFGAIEIDAMTVSGQVGSTVSLGNGCLCCAVDASELDSYLETLTRPSVRLDLIVIEASGLAEPQELVRMLLASENPRIVYGGLVEVVDAAEFDRTRERHPETDRHLAVADLVVLNKTDRIDTAEHDRLRSAVAALTDRAAVVSTDHGRIDPALLFDPALRPDSERTAARQLTFEDLTAGEEEYHGGAGNPGGAHPHAAYQSVELSTGTPLDPRRFLRFLDSRPEGLYRIKGFVDFGAADPRNTYLLHAVGRFLRFAPRPWARDEPRLTQLVLIGAGFDAEALLRELEDCRTPGPGSTGPGGTGAAGVPEAEPRDADELERAMWGVLRYVATDRPAEEAGRPTG